jgi:hypothetical protein
MGPWFQWRPDTLEPSLRRHPVKAATMVNRYEAARDMLASGYPDRLPVIAASPISGTPRASPAQRIMVHQMAFIACDDAHTRPGLLCMNSWGPDWISGPKRHDQPEGSFWVDAEVATKMLRQGDSFALSGYEGLPPPTDRLVTRLNLGAVPVDVWSPLVTQLGLPVALVCFLVWQWAERDKLTQDRFAKLDTSTTERERENASRIMKLEDTMQNA